MTLLYDRRINVRSVIFGLSGGARGALGIALAIAAFFAADSLIFRAGWYTAWLEPQSSAGSLEAQLHWLQNARAARVPDVLVIGDSRIAEGFSASLAGLTVGRRLHFWNFGLGGSTPRVWYYTLRDADPTRRRFSAIVIALDKYADTDWFAESEDRISDQNYLVMQLGLGDCAGFAGSLHSVDLRHHALFACLFRGMILRDDFQAFLKHPEARMAHAEDWRRNGLSYISDYGGKPESLRGLTVDWAKRTIHFPDGVADVVRANVSTFVLPKPVANTGSLARYRQRWLGGILDLYKDSPTRIVFLQLPRGPLVQPVAVQPSLQPRFVDSAALAPRVTVLPEETFEDLERPELFADGLHLNHDGRPLFTKRLAARVDAILQGGSAGSP